MSLSPLQLETIIVSLEATEIARRWAVAAFTLNVWDIIICLDKEIKYFWTGPWTISRALYFWTQSTNAGALSEPLPFPIIDDVSSIPIYQMSCERGIKACFAITVVGLATIQLVLVLRIWYLFPRSLFIRALCISSFVLSTILSAIFVGQSFSLVHSTKIDLSLLGLSPSPSASSPSLSPSPSSPFSSSLQEGLDLQGFAATLNPVITTGCAVPPPGNFWRMYIPSLVLHTLLFVLTTIRAWRTPNIFQEAPLMRRVLRDGGIFYFVVIAVVGIAAVCSFFTDKPKINVPAIYSGALFCFSSVAISRLMLSIQSVAAHLGYDEFWVLTNVELSRVAWRSHKGSHDGEIIVEVDGRIGSFDDLAYGREYDYEHGVDGIELTPTNVHREGRVQDTAKPRPLPRIDTA
ncbi:hypothetical protein D9758_016032 [Tetrapyrgos nigripes]|uniref:DUF6533 domain-containing protein n=1 Tax=Tetrapyrgos nigripes TaxID=182062 RepID=A0A8H5C9R8_9AGAR|nr:hypothetical protein D9758_016032 [Tetrapyrgos nigripes]